ncbi:MAG: hypothetical protein ACFFDT_25565 [Candidatus Hodarchaeota archaeon]
MPNIDNFRVSPYGASTQGIYEESSTQKLPLGTKVEFSDGRVFRYAYIGGSSINRGCIVGPDYSAKCYVETDDVITAAAIGATTVDITLASITANQFAGGYLHITDDTGEGYTYRIKSNDATDGAAGSGKIRLTLYDPLIAALDATTDFAITGCMYNYLVIFDATGGDDFLVSGVTPITFTANYYGWIQTWGVCTILADASAGAIAAGDCISSSDGVDGAVQLQAAYTEQYIGYALFAPDDTGHIGVWLQLCP